MNIVSVEDLHQFITDKKDIQLIDVRESYEFENQNIGGINIPLIELIEKREQIDKVKPVILCCNSGKRSGAMVLTLERKFGLGNIHSLQGGLESYFQQYS